MNENEINACCADCGRRVKIVCSSGIVTPIARRIIGRRTNQIANNELHDAMLLKDPPPKEDCPIYFIPMPSKFISCVSLPDASISSVPIYDFAIALEEFAKMDTDAYYSCCGKSICGCVYSFDQGNADL